MRKECRQGGLVQKMTENQQKVYDYLRERLQSDIPPTVREICDATGIRSTSSVHGILGALEKMGYIERDSQNARSIHLVGSSPAIQVPLIGQVQAGMPVLAVEQIEGYIPFVSSGSSYDKEYFALRVRGESMINAAILDGDIVICERTPVASEGQIVVALIDDEATVKRFYREKKGFRLQPENDDFSPIYCAELTILGKVVASVRSYE